MFMVSCGDEEDKGTCSDGIQNQDELQWIVVAYVPFVWKGTAGHLGSRVR